MKLLTIDFETKDLCLTSDGDGLGLGPGSRFHNHLPDGHPNKDNFKVLDAGFIRHDGTYETTSDWDYLKSVVTCHDGMIMHNAAYDFGCMIALWGLDFHEEIRDKVIFDTVVMAKCYDNTLTGYHLEGLASKYKVGEKATGDLCFEFFNCGLYKEVQEARSNRSCHLTEPPTTTAGKPSKALKALTYQNLELLRDRNPQVYFHYLKQDNIATRGLYDYLKPKIDFPTHIKDCKQNQMSWEDYSNAIKALTVRSHKGCRVDKKNLYIAERDLRNEIDELEAEIYEIVGQTFNVNSNKQIAEVCAEAGIELPLVSKKVAPWSDAQVKFQAAILAAVGEELPKDYNKPVVKLVPTTAKAEIEDLPHPFFKALQSYREYSKLLSGTVLGIQKQLDYTDGDRCFYDTVLLGATETGRYSSRNINIQQIPKRKEYAKKLCRGLFLPDEGYKWASCDFSNQEPRLQVHYASLLKCQGTEGVVNKYLEDPNMSIHNYVADALGMTKAETKPITLGLSYSMGEGKLCKTLGLPTFIKVVNNKNGSYEIECAGAEGRKVLDMYYDAVPFLPALISTTKEVFTKNRYLKVLGGRKVKLRFNSEARKALSKLIQGSAADQTTKAVSLTYAAGLDILNIVHDEINIQIRNEREGRHLKEIMETAFKLVIPVVAELVTGENWAEC